MAFSLCYTDCKPNRKGGLTYGTTPIHFTLYRRDYETQKGIGCQNRLHCSSVRGGRYFSAARTGIRL